MTDALIFLAPGYEEVEMLTVVDMVRRAGLVIDMVSITDTLEVTSSHNVTIKADKLFKEADFDSAKMIILPGGIPGTPNLLAYKPLTDKILEFKENGKLLSAVLISIVMGFIAAILQGVTMIPWYIGTIVKYIFAMTDAGGGATVSAAYSFVLYLLAVVQAFGVYMSMIFSLLGLAYQYGHASEKIDYVMVESDIDNFDKL